MASPHVMYFYGAICLTILIVMSSVTSQECNKKDTVEDLFPGLFVNKTLLGTNGQYKGEIAVLESYKDAVTGKKVKITTNSPATTSTRNKRNTDPNQCCDCCKTQYRWILPLTAKYGGQIVVPVHAVADLYQVLMLGSCSSNSNTGACKGCQCVTENDLTWVLFADPSLSWFPPVEFLPVRYPRECRCV